MTVGEIYALVSPGGAPGVTTTALALTLTWPSPVILAECDPGGGDILAGLLRGQLPARRGVTEHAIEAGRGVDAAQSILARQLIPIDAARRRMLLPGMTDPRQAMGLGPAWSAIASTLAGHPDDVIADCGRLDAGDGQPLPVLLAARVVVMVLRPSLRQVWAARSRIDMLARLLGGTGRLVLLLMGPGLHSAKEIESALGVVVAGLLPADARTAAALSDGAGGRRKLEAGQLFKAASKVGAALRGIGQVSVSLTAVTEVRL